MLLGGGEFGPDDVALTAGVLAAFALAVPFDSLSHLLARAVYATHNTILPVLGVAEGVRVTVATTPRPSWDAWAWGAITAGFRRGTAVKTDPARVALLIRLRQATRRTPCQRSSGLVGITAMNSPSRSS